MPKPISKPLYRTVLLDAWQTLRTHKQLWIWGLFAALLGNAGEYEFIVNATNRVAERSLSAGGVGAGLGAAPVSFSALHGLWNAFVQYPFSTLVLFVIGLIIVALAAFFIWLIVVSVAALVSSTAAVATGRPYPSMAQGVDQGNKAFVPILLAELFGRVVSWFLLTLLVLFAALAIVDAFIGFPLFLVGFVVILPALFLISFIVRYTVMYVVIKKQPLLLAIESSVDLFRRHWLITVELAFFLFVINILVGLVLVMLVGFLVAPMLLAALVSWQMGLGVWAAVLATVGLAIFLAVLFVLGAGLGAYEWAVWTHLFLKLKERGHLSKLVRFAQHWVADRPLTTSRR